MRASAARAVDEDVAHRDGRDREKVRTVAPVGVGGTRELEIDFVHEGGCQDRVARLDRQLAARGAAKLLVDDGQNLIECVALSGAQLGEQLGDAGRIVGADDGAIGFRREVQHGGHERTIGREVARSAAEWCGFATGTRLLREPCGAV
jgi:hypothetical protein